LTKRAHDAVNALHDAGIRFAITSGRPPLGMAMLFDVLDIETPIAGFNGGLFVKRDLTHPGTKDCAGRCRTPGDRIVLCVDVAFRSLLDELFVEVLSMRDLVSDLLRVHLRRLGQPRGKNGGEPAKFGSHQRRQGGDNRCVHAPNG
jgi:hypothetical protein